MFDGVFFAHFFLAFAYSFPSFVLAFIFLSARSYRCMSVCTSLCVCLCVCARSEQLWAEFLSNCNENIHLILVMEPNGAFRVRCRQYPGFIGTTTIDYMQPWQEQVLIKVANVFLAAHPLIDETYLDEIVSHAVHVHQSMHTYSQRYRIEYRRWHFVSPRHYLEFIQTYIRLIGTRNLCFVLTICVFLTKRCADCTQITGLVIRCHALRPYATLPVSRGA